MEDLPILLKNKLIQIIKEKDYRLDNEIPIGIGPVSFVYRIIHNVTGNVCACKAILIPQEKNKSKMEQLVEKIREEVILYI